LVIGGTPILLHDISEKFPISWLKGFGRWVLGHDISGIGLAAVALITLTAGSMVTVFATTSATSVNPASRLASIDSIVEHDSWVINDSVFRYETVDKVRIGDQFLSSKPPMYAALAVLPYLILNRLGGLDFAESRGAALFGLRFVLCVLPFLLGLLVAGRLLGRHLRDDTVIVWGYAAFALGTMAFSYSAEINNHSLAALLVLAAFALVSTDAGSRVSRSRWLATGFLASLAVTMDLGAGAFAVWLAVLLCLRPKRRWATIWLLAGAALPALVHLHLTYRLTGSLLPFYGYVDLYSYPGSYWDSPADFDALTEPRWYYALHTLIGHHGLFAMTPLFLLAFPGVRALIKRPDRRHLGLLIAGVAATTIGVYTVMGPYNYGGTAAGMRWFIVLTPLLWYAALTYVDGRPDGVWLRRCFKLAVIIGMFHAITALPDPFEVSLWNGLFREIGFASVPPYNFLGP
jgi:hypothetical protein